jgi:Na+/H+-dicarboxylate symporter
MKFFKILYVQDITGILALLGKLMLTFYVTSFLFVFVVLNLIAGYYKFSLWRLLVYIKDEILIVLALTLTAVKVIPLEGLALLIGVDRFMSEARSIF